MERTWLSVTAYCPTNIAVIKYWGKRDERLHLPLNSSLSATLDSSNLRTETTVLASRSFEKTRLWLNGKEQVVDAEHLESATRFQRCLREMMARAAEHVSHLNNKGEIVNVAKSEWSSYKFHVISINTFPTAAGLASSASGYACLVYALGQLFGVKEAFEGEVTCIARQGSGSACRSLMGGFVRWEKGTSPDGLDSKAVQVVPETYWPALRVAILVVNDQAKDTGSTSGMQLSVATSPFIQHRADAVVPERLARIEEAIRQRNFDEFAKITMQDSNSFHSVCHDTFPPIFYLNEVSKTIIRLVHAFNQSLGYTAACYTFDAGPNACIFTLDAHLPSLLSYFLLFFPPPVPAPSEGYIRYKDAIIPGVELQPADPSSFPSISAAVKPAPGALKYIILTKVGPGPSVVDPAQSLANPLTGLPSSS